MAKTFKNPQAQIEVSLPDAPKCNICGRAFSPGKEVSVVILSLSSTGEPVPSLACMNCFDTARNAYSLIKGIQTLLTPSKKDKKS